MIYFEAQQKTSHLRDLYHMINMVYAFHSPLKKWTCKSSLPGHLSTLCLSLEFFAHVRLEHLLPRLPYFLSPVGSLGGFAGCSSISSPLTLLEQQELPRRRPGSTHREAPINLGELDKLCTVPSPLRKTRCLEGKPWEAEKDPEGSPGQEQSSVQAQAAHQESSYILQWPPLLFIRAATPPLQPWKQLLGVSRTHPRACLDKLLRTQGSNTLQASQSSILLTAGVSCSSGHQHHPARVQISPWLQQSNSTLGVSVGS